MKKTDMQQPMKMAHDQMQAEHDGHDMAHDMADMDMGGMNMDEMDMTMPGGGHMHMSNFKQKFWVSLVAAIPVFILSPFMGMHLPFQASFPGSDWVVLLLATFLYVYGGEPFLSGAKAELKDKSPAMMTLVAMGISVAYLYSLYAFAANHFFGLHVMDFFWELASLIVIMLLGHWIEMNAVMSAGDVLEKMAQLLPGSAHVQTAAGKLEDVPLAKLQKGQLVQVKAGEKIPADGIITAGQSAVNESLVTGEAKAVAKAAGDKLIGGSVNGDGSLTVKITGTGESGYLAQVGKLVSQAQSEKSKAETLADKVSKWLFYAALSVGILALFVWLALDGLSTGLARMVTVLVIACPHALGLAIPLVVARSTSLAAANGLLIQNRQAIEASKQVDTVLMDKTGTLTAGKFKVNTVLPLAELPADQVLALAAGLEKTSSHPLAAGILTAAREKQLPLAAAKDVQTLQGVGIRGKIGDQSYSIVTAAYLDQQHIAYDQDQFQQLANAGNSLSYLLQGQTLLGLIAQGDQLKAHAKALIADLKARGLTPVMLTGDNEPAAMETARLLGGLTVKANLLSEDKAKIVRSYQSSGHHVLMVGDGVNDAPALATADVGIAIGAGTDVAIDSADVILVKSDPRDILHFLNLAKATNRKMVQNLWWGAGYNILAIPLAAGVLAGVGIILSPAVGAVVMSFSTVIVAANAMMLKLK